MEKTSPKSSIYLSSLKKDNLGINKISGKDLSCLNNYNDIFAGLEIPKFRKNYRQP